MIPFDNALQQSEMNAAGCKPASFLSHVITYWMVLLIEPVVSLSAGVREGVKDGLRCFISGHKPTHGQATAGVGVAY